MALKSIKFPHCEHSVEISAFFCHADFTWNQFWRMFKSSKNAIFAILGLWIFHYGKFQPSENTKIHEKSKLRSSKCVKIAIFGPLTPLKVISRKIWVAKYLNFPHCEVKSNNFHRFFSSFQSIKGIFYALSAIHFAQPTCSTSTS